MATFQLARTVADLEPYVEQWDRLAVSAERPLMRPAWLLAWWHTHCQFDGGSELRVALGFDDRGLLGLLPFYVRDPEARLPVYALLGPGPFWPKAPLLREDAAPETLGQLTQVLAQASPVPAMVDLEAIDTSFDWPDRIATSWPSRGASVYTKVAADPCLCVRLLDGGFDEWLHATRGRPQHRRRLRRLVERGVVMRRSANVAEFRRDLAGLTRLHRLRWAGMLQWVSPEVEIAIDRAGSELIASGGVRLWVLEGADGIVGATLFACAGQESCCLLTAYDRAWSVYGPGIATMIAGIEEAFGRGERLVDLGYGSFEYKRVLANYARPVAWLELFPRGRGHALVRARSVPRHARERVIRLRIRLRLGQRLRTARAGALTHARVLSNRDRVS